ncbi:MAG: hypothetical protein ACTHJ0_00685 [Flavipsychrobacter sp.]
MASIIELKLLPPFIKKNRERNICRSLVLKENLYCITIVVDDANDTLHERIYIDGFDLVKSKTYLPVQGTIFSWQSGAESEPEPSCIYFATSIIRCRQKLRDFNMIMERIMQDERYIGLIEKMSSLVPATISLAYMANIMLRVLDILNKYLGKIDSTPLGLVFNSVSYFDGDLEKRQEKSICLNTKHVDFRYELKVL